MRVGGKPLRGRLGVAAEVRLLAARLRDLCKVAEWSVGKRHHRASRWTRSTPVGVAWTRMGVTGGRARGLDSRRLAEHHRQLPSGRERPVERQVGEGGKAPWLAWLPGGQVLYGGPQQQPEVLAQTLVVGRYVVGECLAIPLSRVGFGHDNRLTASWSAGSRVEGSSVLGEAVGAGGDRTSPATRRGQRPPASRRR